MSGQYAIDSIGANPYFMGAYNFPNANYMTVPKATQTAAAADTTAVTQPAVPVKKAKKEEKKDNSTAKLIVGTALVLGAAYLCRKAYKAGTPGKGTVERIVDGFGQWGKNIKNWGKEVKDKVVNPEKFSVTKIGEETVCTIPNRHNIIKGAEGATEKLGAIGATTEAPAILDTAGKLAEGIKIKNGTFVHEGKTFIVKKGKIVGCEGMSKEAFRDFFQLPKTTENIEGKKKIEETLAKFLKGETGTVTQYSHTKDGVARLFEQNAGGTFDLRGGISNRFNINSDAVNAYRHDNPAVDTVLKGFVENKTEGLKLASAEFSRPDLGTLFIKDGEISAIKWTDGQTYQKGSEKWKALMQTNKDIYENILKDTESLQNRVYQMA